MSENRVIGIKGRIPWYIPEDLGWFRDKTTGHSVIMGRKTYESIGRVLKARKNIILSRRRGFTVRGGVVLDSLEKALDYCEKSGESEAFIIGGESLFREGLLIADRLYLTVIGRKYEGDRFFPPFPEDGFKEIYKKISDSSPVVTFYIFKRTTK